MAKPKLSPHTTLCRVPSLRLRLDHGDEVTITHEGRSMRCTSHGLAVLDAFSRPTAFSEGLARLEQSVAGALDWMELTTTVVHLFEFGVLRDVAAESAVSARPRGYEAPEMHVDMLNDRVRTSSYLAAIDEVVRAGDVVVEIGTGTGVLTMAAARAGARHVYAIEATAIGDAAQEIFRANGLADRITLVKGWSSRVTLPERADVLVSEMIGNEPLAEQVLEITRDAVKRLLKPQHRLIPSAVRLFALPVSVPLGELAGRRFTRKAVEDWRAWYGLDFTPLLGVDRGSPQLFYFKSGSAEHWGTLGDPVLIADLDLAKESRPQVDSSGTFTATGPGLLNGLLVFFELQLGPRTSFSTHPRQARGSSWRHLVWTLPEPLMVEAGASYAVTYRYRSGDEKMAIRPV